MIILSQTLKNGAEIQKIYSSNCTVNQKIRISKDKNFDKGYELAKDHVILKLMRTFFSILKQDQKQDKNQIQLNF